MDIWLRIVQALKDPAWWQVLLAVLALVAAGAAYWIVQPYRDRRARTRREKQMVEALLRYLESHDLIRAPFVLQGPNWSIKAVQEVRSRLKQDLEHVDRSSRAFHPVSQMEANCSGFEVQVWSLALPSLPEEATNYPDEQDQRRFTAAMYSLTVSLNAHMDELYDLYGIAPGHARRIEYKSPERSESIAEDPLFLPQHSYRQDEEALRASRGALYEEDESLRTSNAGAKDFPITRMYPYLPLDVVSKTFRGASRLIRILEVSIDRWELQQYRLDDSIVRAVSQGCQVEILLLDPESIQVRYKDIEYGQPEGYVRDQILRSISDLQRLAVRLSRKAPDIAVENDFQVKLYDAAPSVTLYGADGAYILGMFWRGRLPSNYEVQFEVVGPTADGEKNPLIATIEDHFTDLWQSSASLNPQDIPYGGL